MATATSPSDLLTFDQAYEIIKKNDQSSFEQLYRTLLIRSDYLSSIPPNESYAILHYLVLHGAGTLFNKVIAIPNLMFNIQMKSATKPGKDILEISSENRNKSKEHRQLHDTISTLFRLDKFVDYAKRGQIDQCIKMLEQDEDLVNQKPPYRRYYLIHHLAYDSNRDGFDRIRQACQSTPMDLTLLTNDEKTASEVALEQNHQDFANYLESLSSKMRDIRLKHEQTLREKNQQRTKNSDELEKKISVNGGQHLLPTFTCPLTKELFHDPVILSDGFTYERGAIEKWLADGNKRSPMTNMPLTSTELFPNIAIKQALRELAAKPITP